MQPTAYGSEYDATIVSSKVSARCISAAEAAEKRTPGHCIAVSGKKLRRAQNPIAAESNPVPRGRLPPVLYFPGLAAQLNGG